MKRITFNLQLTVMIAFMLLGYTSWCQQGTWDQQNDFVGTARYYAMSFSIEDKGYVGGGNVNSGYTKDFWEYDPVNDTWTQKADMGGSPRFSGIAFSIGNKGYAGLGSLNGSSPSGDFWEYDPATNDWTQKAVFPGVGRISSVGFSIDTKGYVGTGSETSEIGNETNEFWEYDPVANSWTQMQDFGGDVRDRAVGFSIEGKGYIGTGYHFTGSSPVSYSDFWEYDPINDTWTQKADFEGVSRSNSIGFSINGRGYIGLGYNGSEVVTDMWQYDPAQDDWFQMAYFEGEGRFASTAFCLNDAAYVGLGYYVEPPSGVIELNDIWVYENEFLGLNEAALNDLVSVYPNPVYGIAHVTSADYKILNVEVFDLTGKQVMQVSTNRIDLSGFASGVYLLKVLTDEGLATKKIVKR